MSYKALYRTYRPQTFEDVAGQSHVTITLKNAIKEHRIAHAYLFAGPRGTGKTTIAKILAKAINCTGDHPPCNECPNCKAITQGDHPDVIEIDAASNNGVNEVRDLIDKVKYAPINAKYKVYIIDEVHMIVGAGAAEGAIDAANILKPLLARGELQLIGATTMEEYRKYIEKDTALARRFQSVIVDEPSEEDAISILKATKKNYEKYHNVSISDSAIETAVRLSIKYISEKFLPDKAIDLLDEASSRVKINEEKEVVEDVDIERVVTALAGVPLKNLNESQIDKLVNIKERIENRIIGQDEAVETIVRALKRGAFKLKNSSRPMGTFLFLGPTGVGKTELAKVIAEEYFESNKNIVRLDMSEYMEPNSVSKIIGAPPRIYWI